MPPPSTTPRPGRAERRRRILERLAAGPVRSQAELAEELARRGCAVNQATLSRDLRELGAVKGPAGYAIPADGTAGSDDPELRRRRALREWLHSAVAAQNLVVLRTPAGGAQPLALALDQAPPQGVLGTVAGDDTILVVCADARGARRVARELERSLA